MNNTIITTEEQYFTFIQNNNECIVYFYGDYCNYCVKQKMVFDNMVIDDNDNALPVGQIDITNENITTVFKQNNFGNFTMVPSIAFIQNQQVKLFYEGFLTKKNIDNIRKFCFKK